jgi:Bacterial extracellular solute-binding proteins, family 3
MADSAPSPSADDSDSSPQIQQNLRGNNNQPIGEMKGGTVIGNVIYNYYYREEVKTAVDDPAVSAEADSLPCPYRGLFHFGPGDAEYFFGRESFVEELVRATQTRNFIPLLGASGSGKSSVVFAGLVPKLKLEQAGNWVFTHFRPGADPFYALAEALVPLYMSEIDSTDKITQAGKLAESLKDRTPLSRIFSSIQRKHPKDRVLLIADQFEELYTLCTDETTRRNFLDVLLSGIAAPANCSPFTPVLIATMRADFLGNALSYRPFADVLQNADLKLGSMNRAELTEVIEQPAQKLGVTFEAGLVERILGDVDAEPGILPLLEFALTELWKRRSSKQLTHAVYGEIGEVQGALARHANQEYGKLSEADRKRVRRILIQLVRPGEGAEDTRRIATKAELGEKSWSLVKQLADARLVVTNRNDATDQETVEVVHEALIRNWGELRGWMDTDRGFRAWQERLRGAMRQWQEDADSLLRGAALVEAEEQLRERPEELVSESSFINQSLQSARWRKLKEISLYCIFGSLVTVCFFLTKNIDIEYIMAKKLNEYTFFVTKSESKYKERNKDYYHDLLRLVLTKAYPGEKIEIKTRKIDGSQGMKTNALNINEKDSKNQKVDVDWMKPNNDRNNLARRIDFPLTLGLLSYRLCLVNSNNPEISNISNKDLFQKKINVTQVISWPDMDFLRSDRQISLRETQHYDESINQLSSNKANCFLRGLSEIYIEKEELNKNPKNKFSVANNFHFKYYSPVNFYVARENKKLAKKIDEGLKKSLKSGEFLCIYKHHYGQFIKDAKLKKSNEIFIDRVKLEEMTDQKLHPDFTKDYKSIFKDIEEKQTTKFSKEECDSLIRSLVSKR